MATHPTPPQSESVEELIRKVAEYKERLNEFRVPRCVMFADMAGSTSFTDLHGDVEGRVRIEMTRRVVEEAVDLYGGRVVKALGDGWLSVFDRPVEALQAAFEMQRELRDSRALDADPRRLKIGIDWGLLLEESQDVNGDVVNVGKRLAEEAQADEILISQSVFESIDPYYQARCNPIENLRVRGKSSASVAYRVNWATPVGVPAPGSRGEKVVLEILWSEHESRISWREEEEEDLTLIPYLTHPHVLTEIEELSQRLQETIRMANLHGSVRDAGLTLEQLGMLLFEKLFPEEIRRKIGQSSAEFLVLKLDDSCVHIPWELAHDGSDFLCCRFSMGRLARTSQSARPLRRPAPLASLSFLVIADPCGNLPAAALEGEHLYSLCRTDKRVQFELVSRDVGVEAVKERLSRFDIVHYCGHAEHHAESPDDSAWILQDGELTAGDLENLIRGEKPGPLMVFNNACHSGATEAWKKSGEGWSFGLANAFLLAGCTHYVGVLSELLDTGSKDFARLFYRNIIAGLPVGKALYEARHEHRRQNPGKSLTWAQYVLYGDPDSGIFGTMRTESGTVTSLPIQGREMNERREEKRVIVSVDLARYSEIVASLEQRQGLGPNATRAVEDQIKGMLREGCAQAGSELDDCLVNFAGDGSILAFASAVDADLFAEGLFAASSKWNSRAKSPEEYRCFRMGVYAGRVVIEEGGKISGGAMSAAVRLQQRAGAGEVLLGANAYEALPESRRLRFGEEELIPGKEHDDPFPAHRRRLAEPAPWEPGPEIRKPGTRETSVPGATRTSVEASIPAFQAAKPGRKAILVGVIVVVLALCGIVGERTLDPMGRHHQRALALLMEKADQYEREQNYSAAEAAFSEILRTDPENALAKSRLQGIRSAMARVEEKERVESTDKALTNLEEAIKANPARLAEADRWTSRPLSLAVLGFDESGGAPDSSSALGQALPKEAESLLAGMGFTLVTRERIVEVMREQRLAASDAADPRNSARLGGLLAARILVSGRVSWTQDRVVVELQAIDAEKGILLASTRKEGTDPTALMASLVSDLGAGVRGRFPLQGKVQLNGAGKPGLNIGSKLGVRPDQLFEVFPAAPNPRFEDTLGPSEPICVLRVSQLGEDSALCEIVSSEIPPEDGMRAREKR